jgi:hypothetical protein
LMTFYNKDGPFSYVVLLGVLIMHVVL